MHNLLKIAREKKGLKTREIAALLQIDQALISKFENGQRLPTRNQTEQLADLLEIDPKVLVTAWFKKKIELLLGDDPLGLAALQEVEQERNSDKQKAAEVDQLFEEMEALRIKMEALRKR